MEASLLHFDELPSRLYVVMGVAGCGKSSIGIAISERIGGQYLEGDELHPAENIEKMSNGIALNDEDRWPWLAAIGANMGARDGIVVAGCSALKRSYRESLQKAAGEPILFVYLAGSKELISQRMASREGHFMPVSLLESQFAALEVPGSDEFSISLNIDQTVNEILNEFLGAIKGM